MAQNKIKSADLFSTTGSTDTIVLATTPTINQANLVGTTTNNNAAAGSVGEYVSAALASGSATSLAVGTAKTIISISLTAGDWDVTGCLDLIGAATTQINYVLPSISLTTNTTGPFTNPTYTLGGQVIASYALNTSFPCLTTRVSLASTTTIYLVALVGFGVSTLTAFGSLRARRMR